MTGEDAAEWVGPSSITAAVSRLAKSLDRSQEASLHAAKAETETLNVFGFYRQAFGDSQASSAMKATQSANEASRRVTSALQLLERARQSTREFVAAIAPGLALSDSPN